MDEKVTKESAEKIILRWDSTASEEARERMIFEGDRSEVDRYLRAVDEIQQAMSSVSIEGASCGVKVNGSGAIQIAMARLEDEFRNILITHSDALETEALLELSSVGSAGSMLSAENSAEFEEHTAEVDEETEDNGVLNLSEGESSRRARSSISYKTTPSSISYKTTRSIRELELIPSQAIEDLRSIAERMIAADYLRECVQVYGSVRKSIVDESFWNLGIEKLSIGDIQRLSWDVVEVKIRRWIRAARVCIRVLFSSEKKLCEEIFYGLGAGIDDTCFMETVKGPAIQLFNFAEAISISKREPEKLFKIVDLHDALLDLLPDIDVVFDCKSAESIRVQAAEILSRLAEAARGILSEFENKVLREPSRGTVPGGTIHPLTRFVMNYISLISDYKQTLTELIVSRPSTGNGDPATPDMDFAEMEEKTPLALHLIWTIVILLFNLDIKSKNYVDGSITHIFMMNNIYYVVQKVKGTPELHEMIGDAYLKKLSGRVRQEAIIYQRATWVRVLNCLRDEGLHTSGSFSSGVSKSALRERFKTFNAMFDEVHKTQSTWLIPDIQLREELRISISEKLLPAYRSFLGRYRNHIESGRHPENYIKYSVEDLETAVLDFFEGQQPSSQHFRRR